MARAKGPEALMILEKVAAGTRAPQGELVSLSKLLKTKTKKVAEGTTKTERASRTEHRRYRWRLCANFQIVPIMPEGNRKLVVSSRPHI